MTENKHCYGHFVEYPERQTKAVDRLCFILFLLFVGTVHQRLWTIYENVLIDKVKCNHLHHILMGYLNCDLWLTVNDVIEGEPSVITVSVYKWPVMQKALPYNDAMM